MLWASKNTRLPSARACISIGWRFAKKLATWKAERLA
jgi:hypothetical protein